MLVNIHELQYICEIISGKLPRAEIKLFQSDVDKGWNNFISYVTMTLLGKWHYITQHTSTYSWVTGSNAGWHQWMAGSWHCRHWSTGTTDCKAAAKYCSCRLNSCVFNRMSCIYHTETGPDLQQNFRQIPKFSLRFSYVYPKLWSYDFLSFPKLIYKTNLKRLPKILPKSLYL